MRYYNPLLGRWVNHDPIGEKGCLNLYAYVSNNPVSKVDALGLVQINGFRTPGKFVTKNSYPDPRGEKYTSYQLPVNDNWYMNDPEEGTACNEQPVTIVATRSDSSSYGMLTMGVTLTSSGGNYADLIILWNTCYRHDGTLGFIPSATNKYTTDIPGQKPFDALGNIYYTYAFISYMSCEKCKWKMKFTDAYTNFQGVLGWTMTH